MVEQVSEQVSEQASGRVAILGAGNMGGTILAGLLRAGRGPADVVVSARRPERAAELRRQHGIEVLDNVSAAAWGDTVLIAVKPRDVSGLLKEISPALRPGTLVVSLAAGQTIAALESDLPEGTPVIRVMPNTPSLVDQGMSVLSPSEHCRPEHTERAQELLSATGKVLQVPEAYQDAVTAVSGSGPAYVFYVAEAMIEAGVLLGLPRTTSTELVVQTLFGAATMLRQTGTHPSILREQVTSPGGTTAAALRLLDDQRVRGAFVSAIEAACQRSEQLSKN
ncbi:pyrroline-5-carboxylate reductase [Kineosporia succinea]|uniref:Pyrroline-5-carboxylate reductase n=1 Tax=Kineosporia succinea TaxID=84632 RepID=A0ABT9P335_9ACTN|nr:pyrroline-5-carboxylate reductase [Kineosporia succinea]MDP9827073.1 pyrroline-5-carboxylate reductase [Kineosporia succinea]